MAVLSTILPTIFFLTLTSTSFDTIHKNSIDEPFYGANVYYSLTPYYDLNSISYDYDLETCFINFNYVNVDINVFFTDDDNNTESVLYPLVSFNNLTFELPFYTTNITDYELEFYIDDWNYLSDNTLEIFYNIDLFIVESGVYFDGGVIYRESYVQSSYSGFDVDEFLFTYGLDFTLGISNVDEVYNSLNRIEGNAWENGYEAGSENGYREGLIDGRAENTAILDVLDLIGGAFTAIGSLLAIQILPNIYLGTLIFVPIVIIVIAVIIKLTGK